MITRPTLLCTVRACRMPLTRERDRVVCLAGHSFDLARSGYVNLLQPQDRRSANPGDLPSAIRGRRFLHDSGVTQPLLKDVARVLSASSDDTVLDVGSGEGFYLGSLASEIKFQANGVDISVPAVDAAAKRYPQAEWIVANADRFLPYADCSFTKVMSLTARQNVNEFYRVLRTNGRLLVAIPAADDLIELRGVANDRGARTIETFQSKFRLVEKIRSSTQTWLEEEAVHAVLQAIYRPREAVRVEAQQVTFSLDLLLFERLAENDIP